MNTSSVNSNKLSEINFSGRRYLEKCYVACGLEITNVYCIKDIKRRNVTKTGGKLAKKKQLRKKDQRKMIRENKDRDFNGIQWNSMCASLSELSGPPHPV